MTIDYAIADRISDAIIDALNNEIRSDANWRPEILLLGTLLGLKGYLRTAPTAGQPVPLGALETAVDNCLWSLREYLETEGNLNQ